MLWKVILFSLSTVVISFILMKLIEIFAVEGWQDENGFHRGQESESRDDLCP